MSYRKRVRSRDPKWDVIERPRFSWGKLILCILSTLFDVIVLLDIILLILGRIGHAPGITLLIISIGFSLLCKFLWRGSTTRLGTAIILFLIALLITTTLLAYAGIEPFLSIKNELSIRVSEIGVSAWEKIITTIESLRTFVMDKN